MPEPTSYAFRTVVGGFHKGDVSAYIAKTAAEHQAQIAALQNQLESLQLENEQLRQQNQVPISSPDSSSSDVSSTPEEAAASSLRDQELTAYRRAEAAERLACRRAKKLYQEMQNICDRSAQQLDDTDSVAQTAIDTIRAQLDAIHSSITALYEAVRSSSEELRIMGQMIPDPAEGLEE